jgi:2-amino-4-hydroxy-6-hydroxymethyldihydropteridine diphosphokinase
VGKIKTYKAILLMQENLKHYKVILALGSNQDDSLNQLKLAFQFIQTLGSISNFSSVYESKPVGFTSSNLFSNMVLELITEFEPLSLLHLVLKYENDCGRIRLNDGYSDRPIDIDIILFEDFEINTKELTLPHPRYQERDFVMIPLLELRNENIKIQSFNFEQELASLHMVHSLIKVQLKKSDIVQSWI